MSDEFTPGSGTPTLDELKAYCPGSPINRRRFLQRLAEKRQQDPNANWRAFFFFRTAAALEKELKRHGLAA